MTIMCEAEDGTAYAVVSYADPFDAHRAFREYAEAYPEATMWLEGGED